MLRFGERASLQWCEMCREGRGNALLGVAFRAGRREGRQWGLKKRPESTLILLVLVVCRHN
jgi:hypothetical protein